MNARKSVFIISLIFIVTVGLTLPTTAHEDSHDGEENPHMGEKTIKVIIQDSVTNDPITGDIELADKTLRNVSVASLSVPEGESELTVTADGYSNLTTTVNTTKYGSSGIVSLEPKTNELQVRTVGLNGEKSEVDSIQVNPVDLSSSSITRNTSSHTVNEAYQGYNYEIEARLGDTVVASRTVEIREETEVKLVVDEHIEVPVVNINIRPQVGGLILAIIGTGFFGSIVFYWKKQE